MYEEMGLDAADEGWQLAALEPVEQRLGHDVAVVVVDDAAIGHPAACGAAKSLATRLPGLSNPEARFGYGVHRRQVEAAGHGTSRDPRHSLSGCEIAAFVPSSFKPHQTEMGCIDLWDSDPA
jgi:hypothetical protein